MKGKSTVAAMKKATTKSTVAAVKKATTSVRGPPWTTEPTVGTMKKREQEMEKKVEELAMQLSSVQKQVEELSTTSVLTPQLSSVEKKVDELATVTRALQKKLDWSMKPRHPTGAPPPKRSPASLPFPWEQHYSEMYKIWYFWNSQTGESVWERPFL